MNTVEDFMDFQLKKGSSNFQILDQPPTGSGVLRLVLEKKKQKKGVPCSPYTS